MGKSSAPEPTPPKETAAAQTGQNVTTAIAQQMMNNVNQTTPYGSLTYNQTGSYQMTDPNSGEVYDIPTWEAIQALSPEQQQLYNSQTQVGQNLAELAVNASGRLDDLLSKPVDYSAVGGMQQYATPPPPVMQPYGSAQSLAEMLQGAGDMQSGFGRSAMQTGVGGSQDYTRGVTAPQLQSTVQANGSQNGNIANAGAIQSSAGIDRIGNLPQVSANVTPGQYQTGLGSAGDITNNAGLSGIRDVSAPGQVNYTAPEFGSINPMGQAGDIQTQIGAVDGVNRNIGNTSGDIQYDIAGAGNVLRSFGQTSGDIQYGYGGDFAEQRDKVEQALFDRMQPLMDRDLGQLEARLASQGLRIGSEAYGDAMDDRSRGVNDARLGAILNAGQEQTRLVNMERDRGVFSNNAQQQEYGQLADRARFSNEGQAQIFGQNAAQAQFNNSAQAQEFGQLAQRKQTELQAQAQEFAMMAQRMQSTNAAQAQQYQQMADQYSREASVQGQQASQALQSAQLDLGAQTTNAQLGLQASGQGVDRDIAANNLQLAGGQFQNQAQQQLFQQLLGSGQFANAAQSQQFSDQLASANLSSQNQQFNTNTNMAAQMANRDAGMQEAQFSNAAQAQQFGQNLTQTQTGNQASTQNLQNQLAAAGFGNDALSQMFGQGVTNAGLNNDALSQMFGQNLAAGQFANEAQGQDFGQQLSLANLLNGTQQQGFNQLLAGAGLAQQDIGNERAQVDSVNDIMNTTYDRTVANNVRSVDQANAQRSQALQELLAQRNQPINEIAALLSGGQVQNPNFVNPNTAQLANTDIAGITANYDAQKMAAWQQQNAMTQSLWGGILGLGAGGLSGGYF
jgi:hypothetical protein